MVKIKGNLEKVVARIVELIQEKKGYDVTVINVGAVSSFTDHLIICSADSVRQVQTISDHISDRMKKEGIKPAHIEGYSHARWVLMDYLDILVNIFNPETRDFYALERLWHDAPVRQISAEN